MRCVEDLVERKFAKFVGGSEQIDNFDLLVALAYLVKVLAIYSYIVLVSVVEIWRHFV